MSYTTSVPTSTFISITMHYYSHFHHYFFLIFSVTNVLHLNEIGENENSRTTNNIVRHYDD